MILCLPTMVSTGSQCYYFICKVGNLILKLWGSQGKAATEHSAFSYWPYRPCQLLNFCMKCMKMGFFTSVLIWAAAASGRCWGKGGVGNPSLSVCSTEMLYFHLRGTHFQNLGSALHKSEGKFQNETKPWSNLGFLISKQHYLVSSIWYPAN